MSLAEYGKRLEALGRQFQDPNYRVEDLMRSCMDLGLILAFRVEPDPTKSVDLNVGFPTEGYAP
jgi:hypothetical protein